MTGADNLNSRDPVSMWKEPRRASTPAAARAGYGTEAPAPADSAELEHERRLLDRLERIRRCALEEGAYATPGIDRAIAETRAAIAELELEPAEELAP